jgi:hypothetical protein
LSVTILDKGAARMDQGPQGTAPAKALFDSALSELITSLSLNEITQPDGSAWLPLVSHAPFHQGSCGQARLFDGGGLARVVTCSITAPAIGLDSHMLFAFTPSSSGVPHFTVDSVQAGDHMAFHLDLIPRVDMATHLAYMDWAFGGLTPSFTAAAAIEGLSPAMITPRQRAVMSPWMVVNRATPQAFDHVEPLVLTYLKHWLGLLASGVPADCLPDQTAANLSQRDKANKAIIFDPDVDKVWNQIRGLIGNDAVETIRDKLMETDVGEGVNQ